MVSEGFMGVKLGLMWDEKNVCLLSLIMLRDIHVFTRGKNLSPFRSSVE